MPVNFFGLTDATSTPRARPCRIAANLNSIRFRLRCPTEGSGDRPISPGTPSSSYPSSRPATTAAGSARSPPASWSAITCSASPTPPTTWRRSPATWAHDGPPFVWDEEERRHLRARLDALYFHLYGLGRDDAGYVLNTFPIVRREDEKAFNSYRTRDLILAYMNALAAGDTETTVSR